MARILAIDDDPDILDLIRRIAEAQGHVVETLSSSLLFMKAFVRFKPNVVALDLVMPGIDGFEIIQWLVDVDYSARLVVMSGHGHNTLIANTIAKAKGRISVVTLSKPFRKQELEAAIDLGRTDA